MKKNQIKGLLHDLLKYNQDFNPVASKIFLLHKLEANLLNGEILYPDEDDVYFFYKGKVNWFRQRLISLGADIKNFSLARLIVVGSKEKAAINYKGELFEAELFW